MSNRKKRNGGIIIGPLLVVGAVLCLWHNEGRFDYATAAKETVEIQSVNEFDPNVWEGAVSMSGGLEDFGPIKGVYVEQFPGYMRVFRHAQIYSWRKSTRDNKTRWDKGWYSSLQHNERNSGLIKRFNSTSYYLKKYKIGDLEISTKDLHFLNASETISPSNLSLTNQGQNAGLSPSGNYYYQSSSPGSSTLGDERISFSGIPQNSVSTYFGTIDGVKAVAKQYDYSDSIVSTLINDDGKLHHLINGNREMAISTIDSHFSRVTWMVRGIGTLAVIFGFYAFFSYFLQILMRIPLLGGLVESGVFLISLTLGVMVSLTTIVASIVVHNIVAVLVSIGVVAAITFAIMAAAKKSKSKVREQIKSADLKAIRKKKPELKVVSDDTPSEEVNRFHIERVESTFLNLVQMAIADNKLDRSENLFLLEWGKEHGLERKRMGELFKQAKNERGQYHGNSKEDLSYLICIAMEDGHLSAKELQHIYSFGKMVGMTRAQVKKMVVNISNGVEDNTTAPAMDYAA